MKKNLLRSLSKGVLAAALLVLGFGCGQKNLDYDQLRLRYFDRLTGQGTDLTDSLVIARLKTMDEGVLKSWETLNKAADRDYLWNDRDAQDDSISPFRPASITSAIGRLSALSVAWATPGSAYYHNDALKTDVIAGMEWLYANKWSPKHPMYGNWWDWIIGMTWSVNNFLVTMYDELTPEQRAKYVEALDYYAPDVTYEGASTGANKIWQCYSMALRGIIAHDGAKIRMGIDGLNTEFKYVTTHDGFYRDGSFLQHQWHPYTGGYGAGMLSYLVTVIQLVDGSEWAVDPAHVTMMGEWVENSYLPLIYQGAMMETVRGREIARQAASDRATGHSILLSSYNVGMLSAPDVKQRILSRVKYEILSDHQRNFLAVDAPTWQLTELREFLTSPAVQAAAPAPYLKQFSMADRVMYVRPSFAFSLAMSSSRIENYESIDTENMMAWHTGDGVTYLYNGDQAQYTDHFWSTVDWYRLPGITVDAAQKHEVKSLVFGKGVLYADGYKSPHSWVGGSQIEGLYGISGMWFQDEKSTLQAKKTWMMSGDAVLCLGAGVTSSDNRPIETIVENRKLAGEAILMASDGEMLGVNASLSLAAPQWIWASSTLENTSVGYYFPQAQPIRALRESRTGSWRDFSKYGDPTPVTRDYVTIWVDHGKNPQGSTYAYVVLPGVSAEGLKQYAAAPGIQVLSNTPAIQAAQSAEGVTGINFWEAGNLPVAGVSVDAPASVTLRENDSRLVIGLSDPTMLREEAITLELARNVKGLVAENPGVTVMSLSPLKIKVDVKGAQGRTFELAFDK